MRRLLRLHRPLLLLLGSVLLASTAAAHMMPAQQGTLNIIDNAVFAALSLPVSAITDIDDDRDGRLSARELAAHTDTLRAQVAARVRLLDGDRAGRLDLVMPMAEPDERDPTSLAGSTHVLVLMKVTFSAAPTALRLEADVFGTGPGERQLTIKATRGMETEAIVLTPSRTTHAFFRAPWLVLGDYIVVGVEHILGGTDHLLFLLTLIVAAAGWRYWFGVLTSFTIAHSLSLTASLFGLVRVSPAVVEPLIAASIVLMALLNLRQRGTVPSHRIAIVFACGLLHGLGFASSMTDMGLHGAYRVTSIVGFNVGIELGQAAFLLALLLIAHLWTRIGTRLSRSGVLQRHRRAVDTTLAPMRLVSIVALLLGGLWFIERLSASAHLLAQSAPR